MDGLTWPVVIALALADSVNPCVLAILFMILAGDLYTEFKKPYGDYSWTALILIGRDWLLATLIAAFFGLWLAITIFRNR